MSVTEIENWNTAYGLSKGLLRNLVVGIITMLCMAVVALSLALKKANEKISQVQNQRVMDIKEFNNRLQHEKDIQDSLNMTYIQNYYRIKAAKDVQN